MYIEKLFITWQWIQILVSFCDALLDACFSLTWNTHRWVAYYANKHWPFLYFSGHFSFMFHVFYVVVCWSSSFNVVLLIFKNIFFSVQSRLKKCMYEKSFQRRKRQNFLNKFFYFSLNIQVIYALEAF